MRQPNSHCNLSSVPDELTARTDPECARKRAEYLAIKGVRNVLELCVGPSLSLLEDAYGCYGMNVTGNDIDSRWKAYHPTGKWLIGDALAIDFSSYDCVVFAPPLSRGCTGKREDSLMIDEVTPRYEDFMRVIRESSFTGIAVLVLPARSLATRMDRNQTYRLLSRIGGDTWIQVNELTAGTRKIRKYVDVYFGVGPKHPL